MSEASISIEKGTAKDVKLLQQFLATAPRAEQLRVLTRCARHGSRRMVSAALPHLIELDVALAEELALELAGRGEKRARDEWMLRLLSVVSTPACLERAEALFELAVESGEALERGFAWLPGALARARERRESVAFIRAHFEIATRGGRAYSWFAQLLDAPDTTAAERLVLFDVLVDARDEATLRRGDLPLSYRALTHVHGPAAECFDRLSGALSALDPDDALVAFCGAGHLPESPDVRWVEWWRRRFDGDLTRQRAAMFAVLNATAWERQQTSPACAAARAFIIEHRNAPPWSERTFALIDSLKVLDEAQLADLLSHGVQAAAIGYDAWGHRCLATYLDRFSNCARAEHLAELEALVARFGPRDAPAAWLKSALERISARLGVAT